MLGHHLHILLKRYTSLKAIKFILFIGFFLILTAVWLHSADSKESLLPRKEVKISEKKALALFLEGEYEDYLYFTRGQEKENKLAWAQFQEMHQEGKKLKNEMSKLSNQDELQNTVNYLEISRLGDYEEMFQKIKQSKIVEMNLPLFEAAYFLFMVKIAEENPLNFNKNLFKDLFRLKKSLELLRLEDTETAFYYYKRKLANVLDLDLGSPLNQYLVQIAILKKIYSKEEIEKIKKDLLSLPFDELKSTIYAYNKDDVRKK
jgi:hypothetical protein